MILIFGTARANAEGFCTARAGPDKDTLPLSTAELLWVWALPWALHGLCWGLALQGYSALGRCRNTLWLLLVTAGIRGGWALQGYSSVGHCRHTLRLGTAGIRCGWALQGLAVAGILCGWTLQGRLGNTEIFRSWALQGYLLIGHCRGTWWLGIARIFGGWAPQGYAVVGHCRDKQRRCRLDAKTDTLQLGIAGIFCGGLCDTWWLENAGIRRGWALQGNGGWAPQGYAVVGHYKDTQRLGAAKIFCDWALQGHSAVGHCRALSAARICIWAVQGYFAVAC